ncbi:LysR family transcriptional regulator, partial [Agrobacterium larrymoorei]|nr:LysR family transcriptional regulator [Agrobacterium larrymoorei]
MQLPRRFLPPLPWLAAFEAAARTGSVTAAAKELSLTQSAVSRQIRALEEQLSVNQHRTFTPFTYPILTPCMRSALGLPGAGRGCRG